MKEIITNCSNCFYYEESDNNDKECKLGKHSAPGYKNKVVKTEDETWLISKACPFHRHAKEVEKFPELNHRSNILRKVALKYVLVGSLSDSDNDEQQVENLINNIKDILKYSQYPPKKLYITDNRVNFSDKIGPQYVINKLKTLNIEYRYKKAHSKIKHNRLVAEFVDTKYLTFPFLIYLSNLNVDHSNNNYVDWFNGFTNGLNCLLYHRMQTVLFAGSEDSDYFISTALFKLALSNFKEIIDSSEEFSYDCPSKQAVYTLNEVLEFGQECIKNNQKHIYHCD